MPLQLEGKVIVITGSLGAAGSAATKLFTERGALVAACDIRPSAESDGFGELQGRVGGDRLIYVQADMTKEDQVQALMDKVDQAFGRLDGSYHTTYVNRSRTVAEQTLADWEDSIKGTLTSTFLVCKHAAELMIRSGGGSIVNVSSVLGTYPKTGNSAYGAGKAGVEQLTRYLAVEYAKQGIRANAVVPGDFKSEQVLEHMSEQHLSWIRSCSTVGRSGRPNEINEVAAFLLSDAASYVTGSLYPVTGGIWLNPDSNE
ncbi:SDR family NAD(P)-dependent oxidoreductase [Paenibacillus sp. MBLB4367]|uniref:SDR family NAD(P)-dependent oxidoreductase n=1 Tax=Paenibacillus sp. MBLB4367 TaxID=3384767 RepID=UPI003907EB53